MSSNDLHRPLDKPRRLKIEFHLVDEKAEEQGPGENPPEEPLEPFCREIGKPMRMEVWRAMSDARGVGKPSQNPRAMRPRKRSHQMGSPVGKTGPTSYRHRICGKGA